MLLQKFQPRILRKLWFVCASSLLLALTLSGQARASAGSPNSLQTSSPAPAAYHLPPAKLTQAIALSRARLFVHFGSEVWQLAALWLFLSTGLAAGLGNWIRSKIRRGWVQGGVFSAIAASLLFVAVQAPSDAISHGFSLSYGISVQQWPSWLADEAKALALTVSLEAPTLMLVFGLLNWKWSQRRYWFWCWLFAVPVVIFGTFIQPELIAPIFDKFEPLAHSQPALVAELGKVVARTGTGIPPERMFLMKASEKTNGLNAYVSGIGSSMRVVVWDTTAGRIPQDEVLFIFGHESGHYALNHIPKGMALTLIGMLAVFWLAALGSGWLVRRSGRAWHMDAVASLPGLIVLLLAVTALQIVTEPIQSTISRYFEHEADIYGQEAMHGIVADPRKTAVAAFNDLGEAYLDDPNPIPLLEFWSYDHPSLKNRASFAARYDPWAAGGTAGQTPRFFAK